ncbi:g7594 [Coccomyxa elongata]
MSTENGCSCALGLSSRPSTSHHKSAGQEASFSLRPLSGDLGVEVIGVDLKGGISSELHAQLQEVMHTRDLLLFRGQDLTPKDEDAFMRGFPHNEEAIASDKLSNFYFKDWRVPDHKLVAVQFSGLRLDNHFGVTSEEFNLSAKNRQAGISFKTLWHMDLAQNQVPPEWVSLYMLQKPQNGGDTLFASTVGAYERLTPDQKTFVDSLEVVNRRPDSFEGTFQIEETGTWTDDPVQASGRVDSESSRRFEYTQPFAIRDPYTGQKSLLYHTRFFHCFKGYSRAESRTIIEEVLLPAIAPEHTYRHEWQNGDFIAWSNRKIIHTSTDPEKYADEARLFHLVFLDSKQPLIPARA